MNKQKKEYELIKFEDGEFSLDVNVSPNEETVWLTLEEIGLLFGRDRSVIGKHIKSIINDLELNIDSVRANFAHTASDGKTYYVDHYNLDMILAVGYRVKSRRGIMFRQWANSILKQYLLNGYSINNQRCLDCQENIISLNNKVNTLIENNINLNNRLLSLEATDTILSNMLFYENNIFEAYSYIKQLFLSANKEIIIIDGYIDLSVLDMLNDITIPITIYTLPRAIISNQDISKFQISHKLTIHRTNIIHDRFIIIDDVIYSIGSSIKDVGKKRFIMTRLTTIKKSELLLKL